MELDQAKAEAFAEKLLQAVDGASLSLLTSIGHRTGLFDSMAELPPSTSKEIARAAALDERYVREWLGGMVVAEVVHYDPDTGRYALPPEHAAFTTTAVGPDNIGFFTQYISMMGEIENEIVRVFREGGGVPYTSYQRFQSLQREETARVYDAALVEGILPLVPGLVERLDDGIRVLDVGTGAGHAINVMARAFPNSSFRGTDISQEGVDLAMAEAESWELTNVGFDLEDTTGTTGRYDLVTAFDTIHDQANPTAALRSIADALNPNGVFLMGDINFSTNLEDNVGNLFAPSIFAFSVFHCLTVSLAYGGEGLGTAWGEQLARSKLAEAGFTKVETNQIDGDFLNLYYIAQKAE
jgi:2-polyprenyl-3-methyl-5-hydroxy-6-metoxy-1,4-benzoquinol methylase